MNKEIEVYAVITSSGYYDDYHENVERLFTNIDDANRMAVELDKEHELHKDMSDEDWDTLISDFDNYYEKRMEELCQEAGIENSWVLNNPQWDDLSRQVNDEFVDWSREHVVKRFDGKYTAESFDHTNHYWENVYNDWHKTKVKPIILEIDDNFTL